MKEFSYKSIVETYYKNTYDKDIIVKVGENTPKLSKQLKAQGIEATEKELIYFGELANFFEAITQDSIYYDENDIKIPDYDELDSWAFNGSCNRNGNSYGGRTAELLSEVDECFYARFYTKDEKPLFRFYYIKDNGELMHAGGYLNSNFEYLENRNSINWCTNYEATTLFLCLLYDKTIEDFKKVTGLDIYNNNGFYSNMSNDCDYKKWGTSEMFNDYYVDIELGRECAECGCTCGDVDDMFFCIDIEDYTCENCATYCDHIQEYVTNDNSAWSEVLDECVYIEHERVYYSDYMNDWVII